MKRTLILPALAIAVALVLWPRISDAQPREVATIEAGAADGPLLWFESLGGSTGDVMKIHVVNPGPDPIEIDGYFAVEPVDLSPEDRDRIFESVKNAFGNHVEALISFYCLEFGAAAPAAGVVYRIAPPAAQEAFGQAARAMEAARRLNEAGLLSPDTNPESYYHSIRQWAIWTLEKRFDKEGFFSAFEEHTRKNAEARGIEWTEAVAQAVRTSAEGRWLDVARILEDAGRDTSAGSR